MYEASNKRCYLRGVKENLEIQPWDWSCGLLFLRVPLIMIGPTNTAWKYGGLGQLHRGYHWSDRRILTQILCRESKWTFGHLPLQSPAGYESEATAEPGKVCHRWSIGHCMHVVLTPVLSTHCTLHTVKFNLNHAYTIPKEGYFARVI